MIPIISGFNRIIHKYPVPFGIILSVVILFANFITGPFIRFPLLDIIPVAMMAWLERKVMAYVVAMILSLVEIFFVFLRPGPEILYVVINAMLAFCVLALYAFLITKARTMFKIIAIQRDDIKLFHAFTAAIGTILQGRAVAPGMAEGTALIYMPISPPGPDDARISQKEVEAEKRRIDLAISATITELNLFRKQLEARGAHEEIPFIDVRLTMLGDTSLYQGSQRRVSDELRSAESAVISEISSIEQTFQRHEKAFMRARASDIHELGLQLLHKLRISGNNHPHGLSSVEPGTIIVADDLLLYDALQMDPINVAAIVTEKTGPASHVAMLARSRGIPAVCDIFGATTQFTTGVSLLVDGNTGSVIMAPTAKQTTYFSTYKHQLHPTSPQQLLLPCVTKDGIKIDLHANIGHPDESAVVLENGLDGVGLFRSEYLFLQAAQPPDLNAQTAGYSEVSAMLNPRPVTIRTMDLGGDKMPRFDENEAMSILRTGVRGLAYSLVEENLFRIQVTAIIRAAQKGNVRIMFPLVKSSSELRQARDMVEGILRREAPGIQLPIGAMIETPSALFDLDAILENADFLSIGTNDLTYSILDMDRRTHGHSLADSFFHPSVVRATHQIVQSARKHGKPVSVCGEAASSPAAACLLIGLGVLNLSINPFSASRLCSAINRMTVGQMNALAEKALKAETETAVSELLSSVPFNTKENP
jgi:phosphotransferase system enzyme I (PtsI)